MPEMLTLLLERGKERELANLSEMNDAEEALSSRALASTPDPSGASTKTRHVISNESEDTPDAMLEDIGTTCCTLDVFSKCVWLLTFTTVVEGLALLHKMAWSQAIHAYRMFFQCCDHLLMRQAFKFGTRIEGMLVILA